jgi:hypothetical protein
VKPHVYRLFEPQLHSSWWRNDFAFIPMSQHYVQAQSSEPVAVKRSASDEPRQQPIHICLHFRVMRNRYTQDLIDTSKEAQFREDDTLLPAVVWDIDNYCDGRDHTRASSVAVGLGTSRCGGRKLLALSEPHEIRDRHALGRA